MSDNGVVSDGQRGVESHEMGGKVGKDSGQKTRNGNNLAKQNDAKSIILLVFFPKMRLQNEENVCVLLDFRT